MTNSGVCQMILLRIGSLCKAKQMQLHLMNSQILNQKVYEQQFIIRTSRQNKIRTMKQNFQKIGHFNGKYKYVYIIKYKKEKTTIISTVEKVDKVGNEI